MGSGFGFGEKTRREAVKSIANLRTFRATRGERGEGLEGISGPYRRLIGVKYGALPREYAVGLDDAVYVVYCYGTPIAWVTMADDATEDGRVSYMPDWQYSPTTTYHQGIVFQAWGDKIVDPKPEKSREDNRGTARGRSSDIRYGRVGRLEDPATAPGRRRPEVSRTAPSGPPERFLTDSRSQRPTRTAPLAYLLDRRYRDPDWTPEPLPEGAERRDVERVLSTQKDRYPSHP